MQIIELTNWLNKKKTLKRIYKATKWYPRKINSMSRLLQRSGNKSLAWKRLLSRLNLGSTRKKNSVWKLSRVTPKFRPWKHKSASWNKKFQLKNLSLTITSWQCMNTQSRRTNKYQSDSSSRRRSRNWALSCKRLKRPNFQCRSSMQRRTGN